MENGQILAVMLGMFITYIIGCFHGKQIGEIETTEFFHMVLNREIPYVLPGQTHPVHIVPYQPKRGVNCEEDG